MKNILCITTGGTIASMPGTNGLTPTISSKELLEFVPELQNICNIDTQQLFSLDSTNMGPDQWKEIVLLIKSNYIDYDGFVIAHGTDTMAYTAAALSYMIQNSDKPIVLTGSQKSIYNRDTDARNNLLRAFIYASADEAWGVQIVFDTKVVLGTRARKVRSKSYNAFSSIDYPETAVFRDLTLFPFIPRPQYNGPVRFYTDMDEHVFVIRMVPGMRSDVFDFVTEVGYHGLVIEGFGVGGIPSNRPEIIESLRKRAEAGYLTVFSTQVAHEGSDLSIYEVGRIAKQLPGVLETYDMTPEAVVTKLMWALGQAEGTEARALFEKRIQFDRF